MNQDFFFNLLVWNETKKKSINLEQQIMERVISRCGDLHT